MSQIGAIAGNVWKGTYDKYTNYFRTYLQYDFNPDYSPTQVSLTMYIGIQRTGGNSAVEFTSSSDKYCTINGTTYGGWDLTGTSIRWSESDTGIRWFGSIVWIYDKSTNGPYNISFYGYGRKVAHGWSGASQTGYITFTVPMRDTRTVTYDANGGINPPIPQTGFYGIPFQLSSSEPTKQYFDFVKWEDRTTNPYTYYLPNEQINLTTNKTLYAVWEQAGESPELTFGSLSDSEMTKWTAKHSKAKVTISGATVREIAQMSSITLTITDGTNTQEEVWNSDFTYPHDIELLLGSFTGTQNVLLTAVDSGGASKQYNIGTIEISEPVYTVNSDFVIHGGFPDVDQDGFAIVSLKAKNMTSNVYETLEGKWTAIAIDSENWTLGNILLAEKYIGASNAIDLQVTYRHTETNTSAGITSFFATTRQANYSNGLANNIFIGGSESDSYSSRIWYSALNNPLYFPELNYVEVGSNDTAVMGLVKVGDYLGVVKQSKPTDTSIYLLYPTSFDDNTAYAVKQSISGIGAASKYCFNVLGDETLFLSPNGVMAIMPTENEQHKIQLRSFYVNKPLINEADLNSAYSFVWQGMYIIAVGGHAYILHGDQKSSWETSKTTLQYEAYYWDNIPATCFVKFGEELWFCDNSNVYKFIDTYADNGVPVSARWSTILDNDGASQYFKTLQKKGNVITLLADENGTSANVYFKQDNQEEVLVKELDSVESDIPIDIFPKKKMKKYKRLQIIVENNKNESFGVSEIVKSYTLGNYAK